MQVELLAYTQRNPALSPERVAGIGDLPVLWEGKGTYPENIIEFAGRVCYRSTHRMGTAPEFIAARVREGHEDIIEHVVVTVRIRNSVEPLHWRTLNRHCEVSDVGNSEWIVSGNTRVWLDFFRHGVALEALPILKAVAPAVFAEYGREKSEPEDEGPAPESLAPDLDVDALLPAQEGPMRVTLLGYTRPLLD